MADFVNRDTNEYRRSTGGLPDPPWIRNPDVSAVVSVPPRYWVVPAFPGTGPITEMDQAAKDAADAAALTASRDAEADGAFDDVESYTRALALVVLDEINILRDLHALPDRTIAQLKTAIRNKLGS